MVLEVIIYVVILVPAAIVFLLAMVMLGLQFYHMIITNWKEIKEYRR